jgi:N-acyl-D-amino-acid deacylase
MTVDLLLQGGTVLDGLGHPGTRADVAIQGERVVAVGNCGQLTARETRDASGLVVAPGFVDLHTHSDGWLLRTGNFEVKTRQGFTTEVLMADGISYAPVRDWNAAEWIFYLRSLNGLRLDHYRGWESLADYQRELDRNTAQNSLLQIPYANVRVNALGWGRQAPDDYQAREIRAAIREGMAQGAAGLSTGLDYISQCFATTGELADACRAMADRGGLYVTHVRYKQGLRRAVEEAVEIAERGGVPLHISHLKASSGLDVDQTLELIDWARRRVDLTFDVYPYQPGSTMLNFLIPNECWERGPLGVLERLREPAIRDRFAAGLAAYDLDLDEIHIAWTQSKDNAVHQGKLLSQYVAETGLSAADALCNLLLEERLAVLLVFNQGDDRLVEPFLQHDLYLMGSDGIYFDDGAVHPRIAGSAARLLGACVRDRHLFSLEEGVRKLTSGPARRFGLRDRGELRPGAFADVVVFDPRTIADQATYENPHQFATGVRDVFVNGTAVVRDGAPLPFSRGLAPGRALKFRE